VSSVGEVLPAAPGSDVDDEYEAAGDGTDEEKTTRCIQPVYL